MGKINKIKLPFGEIEISQQITSELNRSADEAGAATGKSKAPSEGELIRSAEIEKLAAGTDIVAIRQQAKQLALSTSA